MALTLCARIWRVLHWGVLAWVVVVLEKVVSKEDRWISWDTSHMKMYGW